MVCPICGYDTESEECTCSDEAIKKKLIYDYQMELCRRSRERDRKKRKEFFDKIKRFFGIKTSDSKEADAGK